MSKGFNEVFKKRRIILARHGCTEWNEAMRFQGRTDVPLNQEGREQAEKLGRRLASWPVQVVYSSPLVRALDTARAVAAPHGLTPVVLNGLEEIDFGAWEGRSVPSLAEEGAFFEWLKDPFFNVPAGAETWDALSGRVRLALDVVLKEGAERVVVVSHGGIMRVLYALLAGLSPHTVWSLKTHNCAMTGVEIREHDTSIAFSNDDLHLKEIPEGVALPVW